MGPTSPTQLLADQYRDATNLNARIQIYRFGTGCQPWQRWVFERIDAPPTAVILELGCGPARLWLENADRIPPGWSVTLADLSRGMLTEARRNLTSLDRPFRFLQADAQAIPFGDAAFDVVVANHMVYHLPDKPAALAEVGRVLRPGGRLL